MTGYLRAVKGVLSPLLRNFSGQPSAFSSELGMRIGEIEDGEVEYRGKPDPTAVLLICTISLLKLSHG